MEESRQASVELVRTADYTACGVQHSLQFVGCRFRRTRQDCVAVVNARKYIYKVYILTVEIWAVVAFVLKAVDDNALSCIMSSFALDLHLLNLGKIFGDPTVKF